MSSRGAALLTWLAVLGCSSCSILFGDDPDAYHLAPCGERHSRGTCDAGIGASGFGGTDSHDVDATGGTAGSLDFDASADQSSQDDADAVPLPVDDSSFAPEPDPGKLWNDGSSTGQLRIPVCFSDWPHREWDGVLHCSREKPGTACSGESFAGADATALREKLRILLESTWQRFANITFTGFQSCPTLSHQNNSAELPAQIMVTFMTRSTDAPSPTRSITGLGKHADYATDIHVDGQGLLDRDLQARAAILREFGRALGFPYEWLHDDPDAGREGCPLDLPPDPHLDFIARPLGHLIDLDSVMDRCAPGIGNTQLSAGDAIGAQVVYGVKHAGALVDYRGRCAAAAQLFANAPAALLAQACSNDAFDSWSHDSSDSFHNLVPLTNNVSLCIGTNNGVMVSEPCNASSAAEFIPALGVEWRALGNMCLAAVGGYGGSIEIQPCTGASAQKWLFFGTDDNAGITRTHIQSTSFGLCVARPNLVATRGDVLTLALCSASDARQDFAFDEVDHDGFIAIPDGLPRPKLCLNVLGGQPTPGFLLGIWDGCGSAITYNSQFYLSGQFITQGQCMSVVSDGSLPNSDPIAPKACDSDDPAQIWDYHF